MGKLQSGIFGPILGKTSDINFKYSRGKNIASKYVPNPLNPKTPAQVAHRNLFKSLYHVFGSLDKAFIYISCNYTGSSMNHLQKMVGKYIASIPANVDTSDPQLIWSLEFWYWLISYTLGWDPYESPAPPAVINHSLLFDRIAFNPANSKNFPVIGSCAITDRNNSFKEISDFLSVTFPRNNNPLGAFAAFSICYWRDNWYDEDSGTYPSVPHASANIGGHRCLPLYSPAPGPVPAAIVSEISKHQPSFIIGPDNTLQSDSVMLLNSSIFKKLTLSKILRRSNANIQKNIFSDITESSPIDWNFTLQPTDFVIDLVKNGLMWDLEITLISDLPDQYKNLPFKINFSYAKYATSALPTMHLVTGELNSLNLDSHTAELITNHPFAGYIFIEIVGVCYSVPMRLFARTDLVTPWINQLYAFFFDSPFRSMAIKNAYNISAKVTAQVGGLDMPLAGATIALTGTGLNPAPSSVSDLAGVVFFNIPANTYIGNVTMNKAGYKESSTKVEATIKTNEKFDLGSEQLTAN